MNIKTVIEVQAYGDYDICQTVAIMVSEEKINEKIIIQEFYNTMGICSNSGLSEKVLSTISEDLICFLEMKGFTELKTHVIRFSD